MYIRSGSQADIGCSHSIDSYNRILWYRQESGALQLLGYMYAGSPNSEGAVTIAGGSSKGENCTLTTETLHSPGSAVYFCAASFHSAAGPRPTIQKPPKRQPSCCHFIPDSAPLQLHSNQLWSDCNQRLMGRVSPTAAFTTNLQTLDQNRTKVLHQRHP